MADLNSDVKLYVITHIPCTFYNGEAIIPIAVNKTLGDSMGIISSDTGQNVGDLNNLLAEYSTFYWAWKNDFTSKYISFFHFRRYLVLDESNADLNSPNLYGWNAEYVKELFKSYDLILPTPIYFGTNVYDQYCICHEQRFIDRMLEIVNRKYPAYAESFDYAMKYRSGFFCNLFIMRMADFNDYMAFVFDIFNEMQEELKTSGQAKPFAYLGERIFCGYVEYLKRVKNFRVKEVRTIGR